MLYSIIIILLLHDIYELYFLKMYEVWLDSNYFGAQKHKILHKTAWIYSTMMPSSNPAPNTASTDIQTTSRGTVHCVTVLDIKGM